VVLVPEADKGVGLCLKTADVQPYSAHKIQPCIRLLR
jgi:hypothetical protein